MCLFIQLQDKYETRLMPSRKCIAGIEPVCTQQPFVTDTGFFCAWKLILDAFTVGDRLLD